MTDKELLELAAKAAGYEYSYEDTGLMFIHRNGLGTKSWNPLTDDGDALRLAVKLNIHIAFFENTAIAGFGGFMFPSAEEPINNDPYAATRRAIVRAAAEIGKGK